MSAPTAPAELPSVAQALVGARTAGIDRFDAQLLLCAVLERPRSWLIAHDDAVLSAAQHTAFQAFCARCADGEPLAYVLGQKEFHGLLLKVDPRVLTPRADTELLVDWALELLTHPLAGVAHPALADLGTGSGAVALAVKHAHPRARLTATDLSADALAVARSNARRLQIEVEFLAGAWWTPLQGRRFDLILSNPPYIAEDDPHLPALRHEPRLALTPSGDGLAALQAIVAGAPVHLRAGGWLLLEHGHDQAEAVRGLLAAAGFDAVATRRDLGGRERCTGGRAAASVSV